MDKQIITFNLAPRNPNVNGIYYDEESYYKALEDYFKSAALLFDRYDNDTKHYNSNSHNVIGKVLQYNRNVEQNYDTIDIELDTQLHFITPLEYVIGFKLLTNGTIIDEITG